MEDLFEREGIETGDMAKVVEGGEEEVPLEEAAVEEEEEEEAKIGRAGTK